MTEELRGRAVKALALFWLLVHVVLPIVLKPARTTANRRRWRANRQEKALPSQANHLKIHLGPSWYSPCLPWSSSWDSPQQRLPARAPQTLRFFDARTSLVRQKTRSFTKSSSSTSRPSSKQREIEMGRESLALWSEPSERSSIAAALLGASPAFDVTPVGSRGFFPTHVSKVAASARAALAAEWRSSRPISWTMYFRKCRPVNGY